MSLWRKRQVEIHEDYDDGDLEFWHICVAILAAVGFASFLLILISLITLWIS